MELENCPKHTLNYWRQVNFFFLSPTNEDNYSQSALKSLFPLLSPSWQMKMVSGGDRGLDPTPNIRKCFLHPRDIFPDIIFKTWNLIHLKPSPPGHNKMPSSWPSSDWEESGSKLSWELWLSRPLMIENVGKKTFSLQCSVINPLLPDIKAFPFTSC